jgi:poly-gamma-glutamate capsule biosynthesis protein CapA/YwtB (metallophosphatase superfamily)
VRLALAGDTMLGRMVAQHLGQRPLFEPELVEIVRDADLFVLNLECCISERGEPVPKRFTFRAPPAAVETLVHLGVGCVSLANNHAVDYGTEALLDTFEHLREGGITWVGAGATLQEARATAIVEGVSVVAFADHARESAAEPDRPGIAYADLERGVPDWLRDSARGALVTPHWGPNMVSDPRRYVRAAAQQLRDAGATLVAGHSAHVFHGIEGNVLYDLGDFLDDYAIDRELRNDLGLLFFVEVEHDRLRRIEAVPLALEFCHTRLARGDDAAWVRRRFRDACAALGTEVREENERLVVGPQVDA